MKFYEELQQNTCVEWTERSFLQDLTNQLGVGARYSIESINIIHAVRLEVEFADSDFVLFQVDFMNPFKIICRRHFLDKMKKDFTEIYNFMNFCNGIISNLQWLDYKNVVKQSERCIRMRVLSI